MQKFTRHKHLSNLAKAEREREHAYTLVRARTHSSGEWQK